MIVLVPAAGTRTGIRAVLARGPGQHAALAERTVDSLEEYVRNLVGASASLQRSSYNEGRISILTVAPLNPKARRLAVIGQQWLQIEAGEHGGRWELDYTDEDVERARDIIEAVTRGRVVELMSLGRSEVSVTLATGEHVTETGYSSGLGWLPIPGWRARARTVSYEPYQPNGLRG